MLRYAFACGCRFAKGLHLRSGVQAGLGISTLLLYVPTPLAHQSGFLALLSLAIWLLAELRRDVR